MPIPLIIAGGAVTYIIIAGIHSEIIFPWTHERWKFPHYAYDSLLMGAFWLIIDLACVLVGIIYVLGMAIPWTYRKVKVMSEPLGWRKDESGPPRFPPPPITPNVEEAEKQLNQLKGEAKKKSKSRENEQTEPEIPDAVTPLVGYRGWKRMKELPVLLPSGGRHSYWQPGENTAVCYELKYQCERPPTKKHDPGCGFYAKKDIPIGDVQAYIVGAVLGWGKVIEGEAGFRSEKAQIVGLIRKEGAHVEELAQKYDVPLVETPWELEEVAKHAQRLAEDGVPVDTRRLITRVTGEGSNHAEEKRA